MNERNAHTTTTKPRGMRGAWPRDGKLLAEILETGRAKLNPAINGLTSVTATHAVLQVVGDSTYYLVEVTADEAARLGWFKA